jgi:hypothetical protein
MRLGNVTAFHAALIEPRETEGPENRSNGKNQDRPEASREATPDSDLSYIG